MWLLNVVCASSLAATTPNTHTLLSLLLLPTFPPYIYHQPTPLYRKQTTQHNPITHSTTHREELAADLSELEDKVDNITVSNPQVAQEYRWGSGCVGCVRVCGGLGAGVCEEGVCEGVCARVEGCEVVGCWSQ